MPIDRKAKSYRVVCPECEEVRFVIYSQNWNIKKGNCSGRCRKCNININISGLEKGRLWNKGLNVSGMSGHKQSDHQRAVTRKRNLKDNPSKEPEVRKKMSLAKLGKIGNLANNWQGGKVQGQKKRMLREYKDWRMSVYKRDGFTCVVCNKVGGKLNGHHIKEWAKFPELRLNISNGITMCEDCHKLYHKENVGV